MSGVARLVHWQPAYEGKIWGTGRSAVPAIDRDQIHVPQHKRLPNYVKAAYCGANPVSHPKPPNPPWTALEPHCWAKTLGRGRAGIGADAGGGL